MKIRARFVVTGDGTVIENGAVLIRDGRIDALCTAPESRRRADHDFGDAVIVPAFVNAHTHLELSHLAGEIPPGRSLAEWLGRLVALRPIEPVRPLVERAVQQGIAQSLRAGTGTVGDITTHPVWTRPVLAASPLRTVSFGEVIAIGTRRHLLEPRLAAAFDLPDGAHADRLSVGVSPHAPYTVEPSGLRTCADQARRRSLPLCIHLAESREEEEFTRTGSGPLADHLRSLGVWDEQVPVADSTPVALALDVGLLGPRTLAAHANFVSDADLELIRATGTHVVYCPRTHAAFDHPPHRFRDMLAAGINVCLGTDSLASNPSLSILDELRFLYQRHPDVPPDELLSMGTLRGAMALGRGRSTGSLATGKAADIAVIPWRPANDAPGHRPHAAPWCNIFLIDDPPLALFTNGQMIDTGDNLNDQT